MTRLLGVAARCFSDRAERGRLITIQGWREQKIQAFPRHLTYLRILMTLRGTDSFGNAVRSADTLGHSGGCDRALSRIRLSDPKVEHKSRVFRGSSSCCERAGCGPGRSLAAGLTSGKVLLKWARETLERQDIVSVRRSPRSLIRPNRASSVPATYQLFGSANRGGARYHLDRAVAFFDKDVCRTWKAGRVPWRR